MNRTYLYCQTINSILQGNEIRFELEDLPKRIGYAGDIRVNDSMVPGFAGEIINRDGDFLLRPFAGIAVILDGLQLAQDIGGIIRHGSIAQVGGTFFLFGLNGSGTIEYSMQFNEVCS